MRQCVKLEARGGLQDWFINSALHSDALWVIQLSLVKKKDVLVGKKVLYTYKGTSNVGLFWNPKLSPAEVARFNIFQG